eukprot:336982_1
MSILVQRNNEWLSNQYHQPSMIHSPNHSQKQTFKPLSNDQSSNLLSTSLNVNTCGPDGYSTTYNTNYDQQQKQQSSIDKVLECKIREILGNLTKSEQQQQQLNFISVCKILNKTYDNTSKLDELLDNKQNKTLFNDMLNVIKQQGEQLNKLTNINDKLLLQQQQQQLQQQQILKNVENLSKKK